MLFHALSLTTPLPFPVYLYTLLSPFENDFIPCADFCSPLSIPHYREHSSGLDSVLLLKSSYTEGEAEVLAWWTIFIPARDGAKISLSLSEMWENVSHCSASVLSSWTTDFRSSPIALPSLSQHAGYSLRSEAQCHTTNVQESSRRFLICCYMEANHSHPCVVGKSSQLCPRSFFVQDCLLCSSYTWGHPALVRCGYESWRWVLELS